MSMAKPVQKNEPRPVGALGVPDETTGFSEIKSGWPIILGCALGLAFGIIAIPGAAIMVFMKGFSDDFGWSRVEVSFAHTILVAILMLTAPLVGFICDRKRARSAILFSQIAIGLSSLGFSRIGSDLTTFLVLFGVMALLGAGASTISFARIISANFVRTRGLALGLALTGTGISNFFLSILLVPYAASHGWRSGFVALGAATLLVAPLVSLLLRKAKYAPTTASNPEGAPEISGITFTNALGTRIFWLLAVTFFLISLGTAGLLVHFVSMLTDAGMSPARAGAIASGLGVALIIVRVLTGWLVDHYRATTVTAVMLLLAALCLICFAEFGVQLALAGVIAYALAYGAEFDIVGYLTARIFGMRAYGRIYGIFYAAIMLGSSISPIAYGAVFQATGSYAVALLGSAALLVSAAIMALLAPRLSDTLSRGPRNEV